MLKRPQSKQILSDLFYSALRAVNGRMAVEQQLQHAPIEGDVAIVAIGKAATAMMSGAKSLLNEQIKSALVITKEGFGDKTLSWPCIEAGHPVPDAQSLEAGAELLKFIHNIPTKTTLLALISGGASALVEILPENMDLKALQKINKWLLTRGLTIHEMNRIRQSVSLIKGGKILEYLSKNTVKQFLISDVKNDDIEIIGSGLFSLREQNIPSLDVSKLPGWLQEYIQPPEIPAKVLVESYIVASNDMACQAIIKHAKQEKYEVTYHGQTLYGDVFELAELLARKLIDAKPGLHLWGGEPTISLPDKTGTGGRSQSLALALACILENTTGITVLVGATDGNDGCTEDAGAIIDGLTLQRGEINGLCAKDCLAAADAGTFLADAGALISTGPTGTNVMDIVIALKDPISTVS